MAKATDTLKGLPGWPLMLSEAHAALYVGLPPVPLKAAIFDSADAGQLRTGPSVAAAGTIGHVTPHSRVRCSAPPERRIGAIATSAIVPRGVV